MVNFRFNIAVTCSIIVCVVAAESQTAPGSVAASNFFNLFYSFDNTASNGLLSEKAPSKYSVQISTSNAPGHLGATSHSHRRPHGTKTENSRAPVRTLSGERYYSGLLTVTKDGQSQMFYWYFPPRHGKQQDSPLLLWLSGGPGCSSSFAALTENGPFFLLPSVRLLTNQFSWTEVGGVVYVDQPLGTGYSEPGKPGNYAVNEKVVASDLHAFLTDFVRLYPEVKNRPFYITGESYAGHYIPALGDRLLDEPIVGLPLKGLAIGNGWIDPAVQYGKYPDYAYENRLITLEEYQRSKENFRFCEILARSPMWPIAFIQCNMESSKLIGSKNPYDIRIDCMQPPLCYNTSQLGVFMNDPKIQDLLNVPRREWHDCDRVVYAMMSRDWFSRLAVKLGRALQKGLKVLLYHGDQDYICNWRGGLAVADELPWLNRDPFKFTPMKPWVAGGRVAGEWKAIENLAFVKIAKAGHMVPMDQPRTALEMIKAFIDGAPRWSGDNNRGRANLTEVVYG